MTASTFTNEVGLVSHRLDVACENQQLVSRRKPRNVTRVVAKTLTELRESWELFSVETVNTVMVDRTLQESSVDSAVPSSLPADQQPEHSVDTDSSQPDKSDNVVSVQSSTVSTIASQVVASNLHTDVIVVETYSSRSSVMVKSQGARGTTDVGQVPEHDGVERYDLLVNVDSRAVDGGIETSERRLPLSPEELLNYERSHGSVGPVGSSLGDVSKKLDVSCENQQLFSGQKPKNVLHVVDVTLDELRETWQLFCLETMNTVAVNGMSPDKHESSVIPTDTRESWELDSPERVTTVVDDGTLHKSSVTDVLTSGLTTGQEPERSVESDLSQPTSISDTSDLNKPLVSSVNASVVTTRVSEDVSSYSQAVERDSDLSPQTVRLLKDEKALVHDQLQERNDDDNSGIEASDYGLPLSPEEVPSHKPAGESALYDAGQTADLDIKVVEKLSQPAYELLGADVDHVDTQMSELVREGEIEVSESYTGIPDRIHPGTNSLELSEVEMKPSHADVVADEEPVHVSATDETRDITFLHAGAPGQSTHIGDKDLDADTLQTSDNATIDATEQVYADKHPHDDRIGDGYGLETMPCDDETGVDKVDTHPGDGYGLDTVPRDDETGVDTVDTHPGDGYGLETVPRDVETGVDTVDTHPGDGYGLDTVPRDETGVDRVDTHPDDGYGLDTVPRDDETSVDRVDTHPGDSYGLDTMPCDDETGVDRVDTHPGDGYGLDTVPRDDETSVDRVDTHPGDGHGLDTVPRDDETRVDRVDAHAGDGYGLDTMPRDDETSVDRVDTHPGDGYGLDTVPRDDETSVDRVDTHPSDGYGLETMPRDVETGVNIVDTHPGDGNGLETMPRDDEIVVDKVDTHPGDGYGLDTVPRDDETGVDTVDTHPGCLLYTSPSPRD